MIKKLFLAVWLLMAGNAMAQTPSFYLNLSVNDSTLGYLPDLSGWHSASNFGIGDVYIGYFQERYIAAHPYPNARFVNWNYYGDSTGVITDLLHHTYIGLDYEGHVPTCDTLSIEAVFAPVRDGDTLQYVSGTQISRIWDNTSDTATFYRWGAKFDPSVLNGVTEIPQVEACLEPDFDGTVSIPCTYTIELWQGGDESPQNQIYTQNYIVPGEGARWRLIRFNNPVPIDSTQPLWVILSCTMTLSYQTLPICGTGYCGNPNSNYIWTPETGWTHFNTIHPWYAPNSDYHNISWAIRAYTAIPTGRNVQTGVHGIDALPLGNDHVIGGGVYEVGTDVTLTAVPDSGHCFSYWEWNTLDDPDNHYRAYENPVTFTANSNVYYVANFSDQAYFQYNSYPDGYGSVHGAYFATVGSEVTITAEPASGCYFTHWEWYYKCNPSAVYQATENPLTFTVESDVIYTAYFEANSTAIQLTVRSNNTAWGTVSGSGTYWTGETAELRATPNNGYHFLYWKYDGVDEYDFQDNPFYITIYPGLGSSYTLTGFFAPNSGIDESAIDDITIYSHDGCIIVEGAEGEAVSVYDMTGRSVPNKQLSKGVYMVKVGKRAPRKAVVTR